MQVLYASYQGQLCENGTVSTDFHLNQRSVLFDGAFVADMEAGSTQNVRTYPPPDSEIQSCLLSSSIGYDDDANAVAVPCEQHQARSNCACRNISSSELLGVLTRVSYGS